jgi:hypothetical protein
MSTPEALDHRDWAARARKSRTVWDLVGVNPTTLTRMRSSWIGQGWSANYYVNRLSRADAELRSAAGDSPPEGHPAQC